METCVFLGHSNFLQKPALKVAFQKVNLRLRFSHEPKAPRFRTAIHPCSCPIRPGLLFTLVSHRLHTTTSISNACHRVLREMLSCNKPQLHNIEGVLGNQAPPANSTINLVAHSKNKNGLLTSFLPAGTAGAKLGLILVPSNLCCCSPSLIDC